MKKNTLFIASLWACTSGLFAQNNQDPVLVSINNKPVTRSEFEAVYNKNNTASQAIDPKTREEYLDLYINFRLKVEEAMAMGLDTSAAFKKELEGYRRQLAAPYLNVRTVTDDLVKEAFERSREDVHAYHILFIANSDADPKDTLTIYRKALAIKKSIKNPATDFPKLARELSEDPSAKENSGDLGFFNVFQMVYPFETAAYNTPVGKVSDPVRSTFGYHLIYVAERRPARGKMRAAHIFVETGEEKDAEILKQKEQKINEIYAKLKAGDDFAKLAAEFSDDTRSAGQGGELPLFGTGQMVQIFEDAVYGLAANGDVAAPIQTDYGWHIVKRLELKPLPEFDAVKDEYAERVKRDGRNIQSKEAFYALVKKEYGYTEQLKNITALEKLISDSYYEGSWSTDGLDKYDKPIFKIEDKVYMPEVREFTQQDLIKYLNENKKYQRKPKTSPSLIVPTLFEQFVKDRLTDFETERLSAKYPEYRALINEYHDGILLFELMDKKVWSKAVKDTSGLRAFYDAFSNKPAWPLRYRLYTFSCKDEATAKRVKKLAGKQLKTGKDLDINTLNKEINTDSQLNMECAFTILPAKNVDYIDSNKVATGFTPFARRNDFVKFAYIKEILPAGPKKLAEARGFYTTAYQDSLEKEWLADLRNRFPVEINKEVLKP
jgi:peptidyl-prolyl cis-trans isomerase SurA